MGGDAALPRAYLLRHDTLQGVLIAADFDGFVERVCASLYAPSRGRPSLPPGRYFRMLLVGYFEGIDSERGLEWRCADSLSLREFLRLGEREPVPDHSWLSRTRSRLPLEVHDQVFTWVLERLAEHGLIKGERIGVDASTMEANAALRTIVRRDSGETYRAMLARMARGSGIETPTAEDLVRLDRNRTGKKLSNADWERPIDPDARIAKMKDGRTHLAYKPEHAMDLDTGAVIAAEVHASDQGDTRTMPGTLAGAAEHLAAVEAAPKPEAPAELIADKGYHSRDGLKALDGGPWKNRISEPKRDEFSRGHGDDQAAPVGLQQPLAAALRGRPAGVQAACGTGRTRLRPDSRSRRHAPDLAAWPGERAQALPDPCCRIQPGIDHAAADRGGNSQGVQRRRFRPTFRAWRAGCGPTSSGGCDPRSHFWCIKLRASPADLASVPLRPALADPHLDFGQQPGPATQRRSDRFREPARLHTPPNLRPAETC